VKKCKHCQTEIDSNAKICPNCKKKQGMPKWAIVLIVIISLGVIRSMAGGSTDDNSNENNNHNTGTTTIEEKFTLEEGHTGSPDDMNFAYYIEGYIKNNKEKDYSYISVTFTAYDSEGNTLGSCLDNNSGLEANGRWKFKAMCLDDVENIASYKLDEITGY